MAPITVSAETIRSLVQRGSILRPELRSRLEKAATIALFRSVELVDAGTHEYRVESEREPGKAYRVNGACDCPDYAHRAPDGWCGHRLAVGLIERALDDQSRAAEEEAVARYADGLAPKGAAGAAPSFACFRCGVAENIGQDGAGRWVCGSCLYLPDVDPGEDTADLTLPGIVWITVYDRARASGLSDEEAQQRASAALLVTHRMRKTAQEVAA